MADLWLLFWFIMGVNVAYLFAFAFLTYCLILPHKRGHDDLATMTSVATCAAVSWFCGFLVVGPLWALLTMPALLAAVFACVRLCAHVREQRARVRVGLREVGK